MKGTEQDFVWFALDNVFSSAGALGRGTVVAPWNGLPKSSAQFTVLFRSFAEACRSEKERLARVDLGIVYHASVRCESSTIRKLPILPLK